MISKPKFKICRRLGPGVYDKCQTSKFQAATSKGGSLGARRPKALSEYGAQLVEKQKIRCAIYTRVSTSEGLEQEFTSLDNQRESAESYIQSQKSEGWIALPDRYDDGGFTGANTERPALHPGHGRAPCLPVLP